MKLELLAPPKVSVKEKLSTRRIRCHLSAQGVATLTFDHPASSANVFDETTLTELEDHLHELKSINVRGLILRSAKPRIFIAGADIKSILSNIDIKETERLIGYGQKVFEQIACFPAPTVAAIHGACVGGGYELALACDYRLASDARVTKIGLPETKLGIVPAWGGSWRLPRLIGLPKALDIILAGKTPPAHLALKLGMIDDVVPRETLEEQARALIGKGKPHRIPHWTTAHRWVGMLVHALTMRKIMSKTRGHYPALPAALGLVIRNGKASQTEAHANERQVVMMLAKSPEARHLIRTFTLQERAKKRRIGNLTPRKVTDAAVIGAGTMGAGITQWLTSRGVRVKLSDVTPDALAKGLSMIEKTYKDATRRRIMNNVTARRGLDRIYPVTTPVPLKHTDVVIEAAVEVMEVKRAIFRKLESRVSPQTLLATNTSALSISELGKALAHPERLLGIHFFNPVHRMPLVELVRGENTSDEALSAGLQFVQQISKMPVIVNDRPGFIVNRILLPYMIEAGRLFERGLNVHCIDTAMLEFGMPMGPLRLIDEVGADIAAHVAATLQEAFGERLATPSVLLQMIARGWLGKKSGCGFYQYDRTNKAIPNPQLLSLQTSENAKIDDLADRMVAAMINEAARCLEERVTEEPSDIDFAMIMGAGFAPFRGGPLRHADAIGLGRVVGTLEAMGEAPADLLVERYRLNRNFYPDS